MNLILQSTFLWNLTWAVDSVTTCQCI